MDTADNSFALLLAQHAKGATLAELGELMRNLVTQCKATGRPGTLSLSFTFKPSGTDAMTIVAAPHVKLPKSDRPGSIFFADEEGNLSRSHPDQKELPLKVVETAAQPAPIRKAS